MRDHIRAEELFRFGSLRISYPFVRNDYIACLADIYHGCQSRSNQEFKVHLALARQGRPGETWLHKVAAIFFTPDRVGQGV
jgi:hypothetical protein